MTCMIHLAGNRPCPAQAVYRVGWDVNEPAAYEHDPPVYRWLVRPVCPAHLEAAINRALDDAPRAASVRVSMEAP